MGAVFARVFGGGDVGGPGVFGGVSEATPNWLQRSAVWSDSSLIAAANSAGGEGDHVALRGDHLVDAGDDRGGRAEAQPGGWLGG